MNVSTSIEVNHNGVIENINLDFLYVPESSIIINEIEYIDWVIHDDFISLKAKMLHRVIYVDSSTSRPCLNKIPVD